MPKGSTPGFGDEGPGGPLEVHLAGRGKLDRLGVQQPESPSLSSHVLSLFRGRGAAVQAQAAACSSDHRVGLAWVLPSFLPRCPHAGQNTSNTHRKQGLGTLTPTAAPCPEDPGTQRVQNPCWPGSLPSRTSRAFPLLSLPLFSFLALSQSPKARLRPVEASPAREWGSVPGWSSGMPGPIPGVWGLEGGVSPALLVGVGIRSLVRGRGSDRP